MLNALTESGDLTPFGRELCKYPMEPHFSKALLISKYLRCQEELLTVVATLSAEHLWLRVSKQHPQRYTRLLEAMQKEVDPRGDHLSNLHIYESWRD